MMLPNSRQGRLGLLLAAMLAPMAAAQAATFTVTTLNDRNSGSCQVGNCSLREAIIAANLNTGADIITLPAGTYTLTVSGAGENEAALGDLDILESLTINGAGAADTIIDAQGLGDRVLDLRAPNPTTGITVNINDLTVRNGSVDNGVGGGIAVGTLVTATLTHVDVVSNTASNSSQAAGLGTGGGIHNQGTLSLIACNITGNAANVNQAGTGTIGGGGLFNASAGSVTIRSSTISANDVTNVLGTFATGGGILNLGRMVINRDETIQQYSVIGGNAPADGNQAHSGGGISNVGGELSVSDTTISNNTTTLSDPTSNDVNIAEPGGGQAGGGLYATNAGDNRGNVVVTNATISNNYADRLGGGVSNAGAPLTLTHTTIANNAARFQGGGLANISTIAAEITNSTFFANTTGSGGTLDPSGKGGGIYTTGRVNINSATIAANRATAGGQIYVQDNSVANPGTQAASLTLTNTIIDNYRTGDGSSDAAEAGNNCAGHTNRITSGHFNLDSGHSCNLKTSAAFSDLIDTNPLLDAALADNGAQAPLTQTLAINVNSPARERESDQCPAVDQRYFVRSQLCDNGAYEFNGTPAARTYADLKVQIRESKDPAPKDAQLTYTITVTNLGPQTAVGVTASVTLPDSTAFSYNVDKLELIDAASGRSCDTQLGVITCTLGNLDAFQSARFAVIVTPKQEGTFSITASTQASNPNTDSFRGNNRVTEETTIKSSTSVTFPSSGGGGAWAPWLLLIGLPAWLARRARCPRAAST